MEKVEEILTRAHQRAADLQLPYAGALLPGEAYALARQVPGAQIVDVRTQAEWDFVGRIPGAVLLQWNTYPGGAPNSGFVRELEEIIGRTQAPVMFICRSGHRSHHAAAAAAAAGFPQCFNVLEGFEGERNARGQRSSVSGWRFAGLPWEQS
ncbi:MAG: rhodanese-like domain-containing protein [Betaproteobacteria bacterium]|nr:rhodanese-like domain-containing protein [Betaproteobacteria bacterium]